MQKTAHDGVASDTVVELAPLAKDATLFKQQVGGAVIGYLQRQPMAYKVSLHFDVYLTKEGATHEKTVAPAQNGGEERPSSMRSIDGNGARFVHTFHSGSLKKNTWTHVDKSTDVSEKYNEMWAAIEKAMDEFL